MIYAIGDIHGCYDKLVELIKKVPFEEGDTVVFLGDYIDRGPDTKEVLEYLLNFKEYCNADGEMGTRIKTIFLKGNHEAMLMDYLCGIFEDMYLMNGGVATFTSYGGSIPYTKKEITKEHLDFLIGLPLYYETEDYLFVHAGVNPYSGLKEQIEYDLLWIRDSFIAKPHKVGKVVVYGHTPTVSFKPRIQDDKIGLDTAACFGGKLTCMRFPDQEYWQA